MKIAHITSYLVPGYGYEELPLARTQRRMGHQVTITENLTELTPNEAAGLLNVSRMYVMKLVQDGTLPHRMVGNHHRIPYSDLAAYKEQQRARSRDAMDRLYALDRETGITDGPPPPKSAFVSDRGHDA